MSRAVKRAADWPRYMEPRTLAGGAVAYYWKPRKADRDAGFTLPGEPLGRDYGQACARARLLNAHLDAWREGRDTPRAITPERIGTIDWWLEEYQRSEAWSRLKERTRKEYREVIGRLTGLETGLRDDAGAPVPLGRLPVSSLSHAAVDKIYARLRQGLRPGGGTVTRRANMTIDVARRAWKVVARAHPGLFLIPVETQRGRTMMALNPFLDVERVRTRGTVQPATRDEAFALAAALDAIGHPGLALAALVCFEWHQRPENVLAGALTWADWRPAERPSEVRVRHAKTGELVWIPLEVEAEGPDGRPVARLLYPEIEDRIRAATRHGPSLVMMHPWRGRPATLYADFKEAARTVRRARRAAGLPEHVTLAACRHGGMTLLGDGGLTEAQIMSLSGHKTPAAARPYVKATATQRKAAAVARRRHIEGG